MEGSEDVSFLNNTVCGPWLERGKISLLYYMQGLFCVHVVIERFTQLLLEIAKK